MQTELRVMRQGHAEDVPLSFTVTKPAPFSPVDAFLRFGCELWCSASEFDSAVSRLRTFSRQMFDGDQTHLSVHFGWHGEETRPPRHPGSCTLELRVRPQSHLVVSISLLSLAPAISASTLCDTCVIHFSTDPACLDDFIDQLEQGDAGHLHAALWGRDIID